MDTYTIKSIDGAKGIVVVSFSVDGKDQKITAPVNDADALALFLNKYALAYKSGKDQEAALQAVPAEVTSMVGKPQTVELQGMEG
jgi:hypothetical protein